MEPDNVNLINKLSKPIWITMVSSLILVLMFVAICAAVLLGPSSGAQQLKKSVYNSRCNTQIIEINGFLDTSNIAYGDGTVPTAVSSDIISSIKEAEENKQIVGIVLSVDSGGGAPVAGSEIADYISKSSKPSVAWVRSSAASAAYWAILGTNRIVANDNSAVGSIGVTYSYADTTLRNQKDGVVFQQLSIGKYKDTGNPDKPLTQDEKVLILNQAQKIYNNFIDAVAHYRNLDVQTVNTMADGSVMYGKDALKNHLIDEIGGVNEVSQYLEIKTGKNVEFCWN